MLTLEVPGVGSVEVWRENVVQAIIRARALCCHYRLSDVNLFAAPNLNSAENVRPTMGASCIRSGMEL